MDQPPKSPSTLGAEDTRRSYLPFLWGVVAVLLVVWAGLYIAIHALAAPQSVLIYVPALFVLLGVLFFGEGAEVAVAMLVDNDVEQFPKWLQPSFEALEPRRRDHRPPYISGRQAIVVFAVVALTLYCAKLSNIAELQGTSWLAALVPDLARDQVTFTFTLLFPALSALWFAQLPPKFVAHQNPLRTFAWPWTRWLINVSIVLGRYLHVDTPSRWLADCLLPAHRSDIQPLGPGRRKYYETSAMLRGGRGLKSARFIMQINAEGSARATETFRYQAFGKGLRKFPQHVYWDAPIAEGAGVRVTESPPAAGRYSVSGPKVSTVNQEGGTMHQVDWDITLQSDLPVDSELEVELAYETAARAMESRIGADDYFFYNVKLVPTASVFVEVKPHPEAPFIFVDGSAEVNAAEDVAVDREEESRVKIAPYEGGYQFRVEYPLLNSTFRFRWKVAPKPR